MIAHAAAKISKSNRISSLKKKIKIQGLKHLQ